MIDVIEERPTIKEIADFYGVEPQAHRPVEAIREEKIKRQLERMEHDKDM